MKPPPSISFIGTFGLTLVAIAGLFIADTFLAKADKVENDIEAVRLFKQGQALLEQGKAATAIDRLSDAIEIDRTNRQYLRTLARAQMAAGHSADAKLTLTKLLESDSADGQSSLLMAHLLMKEGNDKQAISYFHRATYAHWSEEEDTNRRRARAELIDLLAQQNSKEDLLAELLVYQEQAPKDIQARKRLGELFLQAGSPERASDVFHRILHDQPNNADAYRGLGEADFSEANYRSAQHEFQAALRLAPSDAISQQRLRVCNEVIELDPGVRGLQNGERFRRSRTLLQMTLNDEDQCSVSKDEPDVQNLVTRAQQALDAKANPAKPMEALEANLDLSEQLWQLRKKQCKSSSPTDLPLALVMNRLSQ